jgi:hypothetical protein
MTDIRKKCSECGKEFDSEETIFEVISVPDSSFKSHVLARYCCSCFERIRIEYKKEMGHDLIEVS